MPHNLLMPEEKQKSLRPSWLPLWLWQRRGWIALPTLATLFILVWWLVPPWLYRHTGTAKDAKLKAITDTRTALLAGLIGVGARLTFWLNSRVYRITARTLEVTEQGHITERYTKAIEQLGSDKLDVRLGGIYALERIAVDSERDYPTVVEVLSAFVRESSRRHGTPPSKQGTGQGPAKKPSTTSPGTDAERRPATDVQAALSVLGRLPQQPNVSRGDLTGAQIAGAWLDEANLSDAWLGWTNLSDAWLGGANLSGARLGGANLSDAWLGGANLSGALLSGANLHQAEGLTERQLDGAYGDARTVLPSGLRRPDHWEAR
jgi:Pentapeptide repeats (8 copies)